MDSKNEIIPLYLYSNFQNSCISYNKKSISDMDFICTFYAINPNLKPKPSYTDVFCVTLSGHVIIDISLLYDQLNFNSNCIRFLAWTEKTPCTVPLYIRQNGNNIHISFHEFPINDSYTPYKIPLIYVLLPSTPECLFKNFHFSPSFGKCIPDPQSTLTIGECLVLHNKNITYPDMINKQSTLINYLESKYGNKKKKHYWNYIILLFIFILIIYTLKRK